MTSHSGGKPGASGGEKPGDPAEHDHPGHGPEQGGHDEPLENHPKGPGKGEPGGRPGQGGEKKPAPGSRPGQGTR